GRGKGNGRDSADDRGEDRPRSLLHPHAAFAHLQQADALVAVDGEGILHEVADGGEHPRHHVGVADPVGPRRDVLQEQAARPLDEKQLLDAVDERVREHHLAERAPGAKRFDTPGERSPRQAVVERAVEPFDHAGQRRVHRFADRRAHHRKQRVGERAWILPDRRCDRTLHRRRERVREAGIGGVLQKNLRQDVGDFAAPRVGVVDPFTNRRKLLALGTDEQRLQLGERVVLVDRRRHPALPPGPRVAHGYSPSAPGESLSVIRRASSVSIAANSARSSLSFRSSVDSRVRREACSCACRWISSRIVCCASSSCWRSSRWTRPTWSSIRLTFRSPASARSRSSRDSPGSASPRASIPFFRRWARDSNSCWTCSSRAPSRRRTASLSSAVSLAITSSSRVNRRSVSRACAPNRMSRTLSRLAAPLSSAVVFPSEGRVWVAVAKCSSLMTDPSRGCPRGRPVGYHSAATAPVRRSIIAARLELLSVLQKKIALLGAAGVGKTSLVRRFVSSLFAEKYQTTVGVKVDKKAVRVGAEDVTLMIWDVAGAEERFSVPSSYVKGASGYLLVADGTRADTLEVAGRIVAQIDRDVGPLPFVLVVNKNDLDGWQGGGAPVESLRPRTVAVIASSAKSGEGVEAAFQRLAEALV